MVQCLPRAPLEAGRGVFFSFCTGHFCTTGREESALEARLVVGTVAQFEQEEGFYEPNPNANTIIFSSQCSFFSHFSPLLQPEDPQQTGSPLSNSLL